MPLVPAKLLAWLAQLEEPVAICEVGGRLEPLLGRYSPEISEQLQVSLDAGAPMREAVAALDPFVIPEDRVARFGDPERIFFNINTPDDLAEAERMLGDTTGRFSISISRRSGPATAAR
jgi:molybdopterin-guanine dinucleotide biosynthesis protein A